MLFFMLGIATVAYGQQKEDTAMVSKLLKDADDSLKKSPKSTLALARQAVDISQRTGYKEGLAKGLYELAKAYDAINDERSYVEYLQQALTVSQANNIKEIEGKALNNLGVYYKGLMKYDTALSYLARSLEIFKLRNDTFRVAMTYQNISACFMDQGNFDDGFKAIDVAIAMYRPLHKFREIASLYCNLGITFSELKKYPESLRYTDSAINVYNKLGDTDALYLPYGILAQYYVGKNSFDSAIYYFTKSLVIAVRTGNKREQVFLFTNLAICNEKAGRYSTAEQFYKKALPLAREVSYKAMYYEIPHGMAVLYYKMQDYKNAFLSYDLAYTSKDSIRTAEKERSMSEMTAKFNNAELENKNVLLKKENDLEQVRLQRKNILVYSSLGAALLCLAIGLLIVRQNKFKTNQQKMELEQKQLLAQINPHFIFNCLNSIQQFVVQNDTMNANRYLADFALLMRQTLDNSKDGTIPLRREIEYLENYLSFEHMRFEDKFSYRVQFTPDLNIDTTEIPSMIIQPFVENAIRHGLINLETRKGVLNISFYKKDSFLYCEVDDNGIGMEEAQRLKGQTFIKYQSHGMELTRQRLALVSKMHSKDYEINIINKAGRQQEPEGTTIIIKFPLHV